MVVRSSGSGTRRWRPSLRVGWDAQVRCVVVLTVLVALAAPAGWATAAAQAGDEYESDQFGYTIGWEDPWRANEPLIIEDFEVIALIDGAAFVSLTGLTADWFGLGFASSADVYDFFVQGLLDESADAELEDSDPEAEVPWAEVNSSRDGDPVRSRVEIYSLDDGDVYIYALIEAPEDDFADALDSAAGAITLNGDLFLAQVEDEDAADDEDDAAANNEDEREDDEEVEDAADEDDANQDDAEEDSDDPDDAEGGVDGDTYVSPTFGYELEWDEDDWEVDDESVGERDFLSLIETDQTSLVYVEGYEAYDGDPEDCLEGSAAEILEQDGTDDVEPLEDEDGEEIADEDDGVVFAAFSYTIELEDGDIQDRAGYFTCQTLVEDEAVLAFSFVGVAEEFEDDLPAWEDLLAAVMLPDADDAGDGEDTGDDVDDEDNGSDEDDGDDTAASYRGGPAHTGLQPGPAPSEFGTPAEVWRFETGDEFVGAGAPAVSDELDDGRLVFTNSNAVYAIDSLSGEEVWTYESEANVGFVAPLVLAGGVLYAPGEEGFVSTFHPASGDVLWQTDIGGGMPVNGGPVVAEGVLYVTSWNTNAYALDVESGDILWDAPIGSITFTQPAVADGAMVISVGATVLALSGEDGDELWSVESGADNATSSPAIADGVIFVGSDDGTLFALSLEDGDEVWTADLGGAVGSSPAAVAGVVYAANEDGAVFALDAATGETVWEAELDAGTRAAPSVAYWEDDEGAVYIGDDDGGLNILSLDDGSLVERIEIVEPSAAIFWPVAIVNRQIFVGARDGTVYAL